MKVGVRFLTTNAQLAEQFKRALDFWATILAFSWAPEQTGNCALQLIDGEQILFERASAKIAARSQLPNRPRFEGWIAFNPALSFTREELYRIAVHEIGHIFGLPHSSDASSVMYGYTVEGQEFLDAEDLAELSQRHQLRIRVTASRIPLTHVD
jgi:hypothetical protein